MENYGDIILDADEGLEIKIFEVNGKIVFKAVHANPNECNYANPPCPMGYTHICGSWNTGFTIENDIDKSQFVWIPVGYLNSNGTIDGSMFNQKFGRRNFQNDPFSSTEYHEQMSTHYMAHIASIQRYGGFYVSRYSISQNSQTQKPQSIKGQIPWTDIDFNYAEKICLSYQNDNYISSHLLFGSEYDCILEWFIQSRVKTSSEISTNSKKWGNFSGTVLPTGSNESWCVNNIYDISGNVHELTQEQFNEDLCTIRGGSAHWVSTSNLNCSYRKKFFKNGLIPPFSGFRIALSLN